MIVNRAKLASAVSLVNKAISAKPVIPLFSNFLMEVEQDNARLSATNFEIGVSTNIGIESSESFDIAIPAKTALDLLNSMNSEFINIEFNPSNQTLLIKSDGSETRVNCVDGSEFPPIPNIGPERIKVNKESFKKAVQRVSFAASANQDEVFGGVQLRVDSHHLVFFATNRFRVSCEGIAILSEPVEEISAVIKSTTLDIVNRMIDLNDSDIVEIEFAGNNVRFRSGSTEIVCQIVDGKMVDYKQIILAEPNTIAVLPTLNFLRACKQAAIFSNEKGLSKLSLVGFTAELSVSQEEKGQSNITIPSVIKGSAVDVGLNIHYLNELLEICESSTIQVEIVDNKSLIKFRMDNLPNFWHIIAPIAM